MFQYLLGEHSRPRGRPGPRPAESELIRTTRTEDQFSPERVVGEEEPPYTCAHFQIITIFAYFLIALFGEWSGGRWKVECGRCKGARINGGYGKQEIAKRKNVRGDGRGERGEGLDAEAEEKVQKRGLQPI